MGGEIQSHRLIILPKNPWWGSFQQPIGYAQRLLHHVQVRSQLRPYNNVIHEELQNLSPNMFLLIDNGTTINNDYVQK